MYRTETLQPQVELCLRYTCFHAWFSCTHMWWTLCINLMTSAGLDTGRQARNLRFQKSETLEHLRNSAMQTSHVMQQDIHMLVHKASIVRRAYMPWQITSALETSNRVSLPWILGGVCDGAYQHSTSSRECTLYCTRYDQDPVWWSTRTWQSMGLPSLDKSRFST